MTYCSQRTNAGESSAGDFFDGECERWADDGDGRVLTRKAAGVRPNSRAGDFDARKRGEREFQKQSPRNRKGLYQNAGGRGRSYAIDFRGRRSFGEPQ